MINESTEWWMNDKWISTEWWMNSYEYLMNECIKKWIMNEWMTMQPTAWWMNVLYSVNWVYIVYIHIPVKSDIWSVEWILQNHSAFSSNPNFSQEFIYSYHFMFLESERGILRIVNACARHVSGSMWHVSSFQLFQPLTCKFTK